MDVVSSGNTLVLPSCLLWNDIFLRSQTTGIRHDEISIEKKTLLVKLECESFLSSRNTPMLQPVCSGITVCGRNQRTEMQEHYDEFSIEISGRVGQSGSPIFSGTAHCFSKESENRTAWKSLEVFAYAENLHGDTFARVWIAV